ncbi:hypothetical protein FPHYL_13114 [Fusarium phyllophilum]|uniref:Mid2 domain-containing protein n=1 Tax=Fusarium phyllophilum TaxID=47803 RepID=A0A8H5MPL5_9HYPO|nr:hypothetical protein FPHYL_13114 [Fusarium phyllophilum]
MIPVAGITEPVLMAICVQRPSTPTNTPNFLGKTATTLKVSTTGTHVPIPTRLSLDVAARTLVAQSVQGQSFQSQSSTASSVSETASAAASSTSAVDANESDGLGAGATAGIAVGASVGGLIVLVLVAWLFWWKPRQKHKYQREHGAGYIVPPAAPTLTANPFPPPSGPIHPSTFVAQSPMSGYQQSFTSSPTVMNPHNSGLSSIEQFQKYFPNMSQSERPQSFTYFPEHSAQYAHSPNFLPPYQQQHSHSHNHQQMGIASEMVGSTTLPQEMSTGVEHRINRHSSIGPETELSLARA